MQRLWRKGPLVVSSPPATPPSAIRWYVDRKLLEVPMRCLLWGERIGAAGPRLHYSNELSSPPPLPLPPDWSTEDEGLEATPQTLELSSSVEAKRLGGRGFTRSFEQPAPLPGGSAGHCRWLSEQRTLFRHLWHRQHQTVTRRVTNSHRKRQPIFAYTKRGRNTNNERAQRFEKKNSPPKKNINKCRL